MNRLEAALRAAVADLDAQALTWALVGGLAVSTRAEPRFTRDVDIAVVVKGDDEAERVVATFLSRGYTLRAAVDDQHAGRLATVRLAAPLPGAVDTMVGLLFASSGIEREIAEKADVREVIEGLSVPVARLGHLIVLKALSVEAGRPQDRSDLDHLCAAATEADWILAQDAARLIVVRGYARERDLVDMVAELKR